MAREVRAKKPKKPHMWVIEAYEDGEWQYWHTSHEVRVVAARALLAYGELWPRTRLRLRRYERVGK